MRNMDYSDCFNGFTLRPARPALKRRPLGGSCRRRRLRGVSPQFPLTTSPFRFTSLSTSPSGGGSKKNSARNHPGAEFFQLWVQKLFSLLAAELVGAQLQHEHVR